MPISEAIGAIRPYLGVVFDVGHQNVGFEDIPASLDKLIAAGIPIFKLQEAAALWIAELSADMVLDLRVFTDTIYLSQTTERVDGAIRAKYLNLGEALDAYEADPGPRELRMHFHVPVFLEELGRSRPLVSVWNRRFPNIVRRRCRITWKSRRTRGMCCLRTSRPETSPST
jgi:hypothetical protein